VVLLIGQALLDASCDLTIKATHAGLANSVMYAAGPPTSTAAFADFTEQQVLYAILQWKRCNYHRVCNKYSRKVSKEFRNCLSSRPAHISLCHAHIVKSTGAYWVNSISLLQIAGVWAGTLPSNYQ